MLLTHSGCQLTCRVLVIRWPTYLYSQLTYKVRYITYSLIYSNLYIIFAYISIISQLTIAPIAPHASARAYSSVLPFALSVLIKFLSSYLRACFYYQSSFPLYLLFFARLTLYSGVICLLKASNYIIQQRGLIYYSYIQE